MSKHKAPSRGGKASRKPARGPEPRTASPIPGQSPDPRPEPQPGPAPRPDPRPRPTPRPDRDAEPRFWFGFELPWAKLVIARVAIFVLLALDAFLQISHAPRHGTGFNVAHLRLLDGLAPGRAAFVVLELVSAYLFAMIACGIATRALVPLAAALYAWLYFTSQLDSYQHHYLLALLLLLACFVPWTRPAGTETAAGARLRDRVPSWAIRLVLVQLGIVYAWAAIAKLHGSWLDGSALSLQLETPWMRHLVERLPGHWATASLLILGLELFLAVAVWSPRLWPVAAPLGIAFHLGIEQTGLDIGLFSYHMVALWLLALPDAWVIAVVDRVQPFLSRVRTPVLTATPAALLVIASVVAGAGLARLVRIEAAFGVAIATGIAVVVAGMVGLARRRPLVGLAAAHLVAIACWLPFDRGSDVAVDYYRFWGGSARRLGRTDESRAAYTALLGIDADNPGAHFQLARLDAAAGHDDAALAHYRAVERAEPHRARGFLGEADVLRRRGDVQGARAAARAALAAEPVSTAARALLDELDGGGAPLVPGSPARPAPARPAPARPDDDTP